MNVVATVGQWHKGEEVVAGIFPKTEQKLEIFNLLFLEFAPVFIVKQIILENSKDLIYYIHQFLISVSNFAMKDFL